MKYPPRVIGFLQAVGLGAYIGVFATLAYQVQSWAQANAFPIHPIAGITFFLLAFVISALISGAIILAYPALLFFDGRKQQAIEILFWSGAWLVVLFLTAAACVLLFRF